MSWEKSYAIVRIAEGGSAKVVHQADTLKDAKYWLSYIALPGDAMCQTPKHPKHKGSAGLEYFAHLQERGKILYEEDKWRTKVGGAVSMPQSPA